MIDQVLIFKPSGKVLFKYQPLRNFPTTIVNSLIANNLINERKIVPTDEDDEEIQDPDELIGTYSLDGYTMKYAVYNNSSDKTKLYFTICYSSLLNLRKSEIFLNSIKLLYIDSVIENEDEKKFEAFFDLKLKEFENSSAARNDPKEEEKEKEEVAEVVEEKSNGRQAKALNKKIINGASTKKKSRKWAADGSMIEADYDDNALDFSSNDPSANTSSSNLNQLIGDKENFGSKNKKGNFVISDLSNEMDRILTLGNEKKKNNENDNGSAEKQPFGFLRNIIGGKKITKEDVVQVKNALNNHLIKKNVSPTIANSLTNEIEKDLIGSTTSKFTSVEETAKKALEKQLIKLLTPNTSINLLNEIDNKRKNGSGAPYVISVVGVNGVGKSTNLSKLAFWLLQNNHRVLITACDTFRSGAVEQLRTHVNNLKKLTEETNNGKDQVELYEGGYGGADLVAKIATNAIKYATANQFDIVLLDTAGRRHNDAHLMQPLASFAKAANPDKIIMVGEALVGTDSVLQAQNFNKAFGAGRHLDFFIISKCDTVGDLIGSMVNMVYATGIPILFVGIGQTYTDLRTLSVEWAVNMLMS